MLTMGEFVICSAILTIAFLAMLAVFIKNAVEQKTGVPNLILSIFNIKKYSDIIRNIVKVPKKTDDDIKTGTMKEGQDMVKDMEIKKETPPRANKSPGGFLADLASTMFLWQPSNLFKNRKEKLEEKSKLIDSELDKLLAENMADKTALDMYMPENSRPGMPVDVIEMAKTVHDSDKVEPATPNKDVSVSTIKVEKLDIREGVKPQWDAIVPKKDPALVAQDAVMLESKILEPPATNKAITEAVKNATEAPGAIKEDANMQLNINDMPVWGHTDLGKPLANFKSIKDKDPATNGAEKLSADSPGNHEAEKKTAHNSMELAKGSPVIVPPKTAVASKADATKKALGMDFGNDLLKELQEEQKAEDDKALDIMHDLKGKKIDADELELDSMDVLSRLSLNVKSYKKAKKKSRSKPRL
jgi:hypothetical protein